MGPVTPGALAAPLGLEPDEVAAALAALQAEGFVMRGRFTLAAVADEWCERRLLARIHHYTVKRLRAEIEPVAARDFVRFLLRWQRAAADARMQGPDALEVIVAQLEGFEAPAVAWETEILPARLAEYEPSWLDDHCLAGRTAWARLDPRSGRANGSERSVAPVRTTPITLLARRHARHWASLSAVPDAARPGLRAQAVADCIREHGASFFDELVEGSELLRSQVEDALAELVALGIVTSDSFGGLRALLVPSDRRKPGAGGRRRRRSIPFGMEDAGRWALAHHSRPTQAGPQANPEAVEHVARRLLLRYGVVFWRLLEREADWLPPWRDLLRVYRKLEARGRSAAGVSSPVSPASSSRWRMRSACCARCGASGFRCLGVAVRCRSAQPCGYPDARREARRADRQPRALSERPADGGPLRWGGQFLEKLGPGEAWRLARPCCEVPCRRGSSIWPRPPPTGPTSVRTAIAGRYCRRVPIACLVPGILESIRDARAYQRAMLEQLERRCR